VAELADLMRSVADGTSPAADGELTVVTPPDERSVGVLAFTGHNVVSVDLAGDRIRNWLPEDDLAAPLQPLFLSTLAAATGRTPDNLDMVLFAPATGRPNGMALTELTEFLEPLHPRLARALAQRIGVRAWRCPGGLLTLGRGVAGRWEVSVEVEPALRGFGLGRGLFTAARGMLPVGEQVWAQVAPGNAASIRAALAAGFQAAGSEVLLRPGQVTFGPFTWFTDETEPETAADPDQTAPEDLSTATPGGALVGKVEPGVADLDAAAVAQVAPDAAAVDQAGSAGPATASVTVQQHPVGAQLAETDTVEDPPIEIEPDDHDTNVANSQPLSVSLESATRDEPGV
jgi:hypothetical protein